MTPPKPETISYKPNSTKSTYSSFPSQKAQCLSIVLRNPVVITCVHMAKEFPVLTDHLCSVISKLTVLEEVMRKKKHAVSSTWRCQLKPIFSYTASDVLGAPKPEGDVPESLIPEPNPTPKSRLRTNLDISRS